MQQDGVSSPESDEARSASPLGDHAENLDDESDIHDTPYSTPPHSDAATLSRSPSPEEASGNFVSPDLQRLRRDHSQQGYLDGITKGKPASVQKAFDSGYPFGAELGLHVGRVLGMLQGIRSRAVVLKKMEGDVVDLERRARSELLDIQNFFGSHYWSVDESTGDVLPRWVSKNEYETADGSAVVAKHPLIHRWAATVETVMRDFETDA
ncbi:hypothetical protein POJ06DRAFT_265984 [Lipomyces tetrasporus]|uniref:Protein YAE1 n=1 Tax=Lipomyces tetrasporus TaxID=54092 RepID=A0AAD7R085_9ASCO|nr:uncharacterized protein POJ06DRAFT_265984 [Lipomyces tetrasporus]KAJ8103127.1 hypothetical protein POJ06DRAFT_265984 [Lipomyces tetrasporus]